MRVLIGSMFRDSAKNGELLTYFAQLEIVEQMLHARGDSVSYAFCENGSQDGTLASLVEWTTGRQSVIERFVDGTPYYPSVDKPERWAHIANVANRVLNHIHPEIDHVFVWIESDLLYDPATIVALIDGLCDDRPITAPLLMGMNGKFYDTFGTRKDGVKFRHEPPFHPAMETHDEWITVDSSGGVFAAYAAVACQARYTPDEAYVGYSKTLVAKGYPWSLSTRLAVYHR